MDLRELQLAKARHIATSSEGDRSSTSHHRDSGQAPNGFRVPHRSSSRHTYVESRSVAPRRVNSNDSFSFASSIKCCVGVQGKKKRHHHKGPAVVRSRSHPKRGHSEQRKNHSSSDQWVGLGSVRSSQQYGYPQPRAYGSSGRHSPTHSTVSCPHTIALSTHVQQQQQQQQRGSRNYSSGYSSEVESLRSAVVADDGVAGENSDSDLSDADFSRAVGTRGKSGSTVMMKLAKKFSKKNLPISRDDAYLEGGEWHFDGHRSNSASNLDTLDG